MVAANKSTFKDESQATSEPDGVYTFKPEFGDMKPIQYSDATVNGTANIILQQGAFIDQYTIIFDKDVTDRKLAAQTPGKKPVSEQAVLKVRFSPKLFQELVKFEVELNSVPIEDDVSKDIIA